MYKNDKWRTETVFENKLREMKANAGRDNDVIAFNAINLYQRSGNDVTVLVKEIKRLSDRVNELSAENDRLRIKN